MSVYVDQLLIFGGDDAPRCFRHKPSCHMYADTLAELHAMADKIGMRRSWFQHHDPRFPHYDLVPGKRTLAIMNGAIPHTNREMVAWVRANSANNKSRKESSVPPCRKLSVRNADASPK